MVAQIQTSVQPLEATWAMDVNTDPSCGKTMNPYMALSSSPGPEVTMALGGSTGYPDDHGTAAAWLLDTNMTSGCRPDLGHPHSLYKNQGH